MSYNKELVRSSTGAVTGFKHDIIMTTTDTVPRHRITATQGIVRGNTIRARHLGRDFLAIFRTILGGEVTEYTKLMAESREQAIDRMLEQAADLGANAVVCVRFTTSMLMDTTAELFAFGTAVTIEPE